MAEPVNKMSQEAAVGFIAGNTNFFCPFFQENHALHAIFS
jgi:hypothetical protein